MKDQVDLEDALNGVVAEPEVEVEAQIDEPVITEPEAEEVAESTAPETPKDAPQEPEVVQVEPQPADDADKPWTYHMAMDEKNKRKEIQAELEAEREKFRQNQARLDAIEFERKRNAKPVEAPDVFSDPEGYTQHVQQQAVAQVNPVVSQLQRQVAELKHTPEVVAEADAWFTGLPPQEGKALEARCFSTNDPYGELVKAHKRSSVLQAVGDNPDEWTAFQAWKASQGQQQVSQQQTTQTASTQPQIMPSATKMPSVSSRSGPKWAGPKPLESILPD